MTVRNVIKRKAFVARYQYEKPSLVEDVEGARILRIVMSENLVNREVGRLELVYSRVFGHMSLVHMNFYCLQA